VSHLNEILTVKSSMFKGSNSAWWMGLVSGVEEFVDGVPD